MLFRSGLEQLRAWSGAAAGRALLVLAGTPEEEGVLAALGSVDAALSIACAACLREGGTANVRQVLACMEALRLARPVPTPSVAAAPDPLPHDWREEPGPRVGVLLYRAQRQAGDTALMEACLATLRSCGLAPRALWVSSLRDGATQRGVADLLQREGVEAVLCGTGFASVQFAEAGLGAPLWERLGVPVLQMLCSGRSRASWELSSIGLGPLDLSLQVVLPELDGRITTRVAAFKECLGSADQLGTALLGSVPDDQRLAWISQLSKAWIQLARTPAPSRRLALVLANYPTRNGRLANGVGLDTPASTLAMLRWLAEAGYGLTGPLPDTPDGLMEDLLRGRSNDPESDHRPALTHLSLERYQRWYSTLPQEGRERLEAAWGPPEQDLALEPMEGGGLGFAVRGLGFGNVVLLVQPDRGYARDPERTYHSPDLPPTHAYLAQYLWIRQQFGAHVVVHVGKHGNLEWLPGKGLGLSSGCFPEWALGPVPHLYPFIVNDPGEGSQAKRRAQAVIIDHLTPPLGRAGLHGALQRLEALLDEYWEASQLGSDRCAALRQTLERDLNQLELPQAGANLEERLEAADGYLCELKEAQIRLGLHTFGTLPPLERLAELLLCLARAPQAGLPGLTQALALDLGLELDPWGALEEDRLAEADRDRLAALLATGQLGVAHRRQRSDAAPQRGVDAEPLAASTPRSLRRVGDAVEVLEAEALALVTRELRLAIDGSGFGAARASAPHPLETGLGAAWAAVLGHMRQQLIPKLLSCAAAERQALLTGLAGGRIAAGPSGAPTRGRSDLLPTGRNFYSVDLRGLPSEAAWDLGRRSAELLLELHLQDQGEDLRSLALSVWGTATMRNGGEDIAQALALMGVRPVWDGPTRRLVGIEAIPLAQLARPRVDVTLRISGLFRDAFPQLVAWFDRACRLVASLPEPEALNPLEIGRAHV